MMKKISRGTTFYKRIFPVFWFGFLGLFVVLGLAVMPQRPPLAFFIPPLVMLPLGYLLMRKLVFDLVDEVWDCGDHLLVRNGLVEESVPLANIMNVSATMLVNPARITLRLIRPGQFGNEISFMPPRAIIANPFARNALADELIERAYQARSAR
ncbi:MAG: hypothetical protein ACHQIL_00985 [Steroidobacterales bacterium]